MGARKVVHVLEPGIRFQGLQVGVARDASDRTTIDQRFLRIVLQMTIGAAAARKKTCIRRSRGDVMLDRMVALDARGIGDAFEGLRVANVAVIADGPMPVMQWTRQP
jgi:hypothetical protein